MVESNATYYPNFKYIFDVYIGGATGPLRFKTPANPAGRGLIDVTALAQSEIIITDNLPSLSNTPFYGGTGLAGQIYILAGEEYSITLNGEVIQYNGLGGTGAPAYGLYADANFRPCPNATTPVVALAWGQGANQYYDYLASGGEDVLQYEMALSSVNDTGGKWLTRYPGLNQEIRSDEDFTISWLNYNFEAATGPATVPYAMKIELYQDGVNVGEEIYYNTEANGGQWTTCNTWSGGPTGSQKYISSFKINPADIGGTAAFDQFCLALYPYADYATCTLGPTADSETMCLTINDQNCWGFDPIRFTWLNNLGGRDWYTFIKRNTYTQNANRSTTYKLPGYWSAANYSVGYDSPARYGTTTFKIDLTNTWTASTNWLNEQESEWLRSMFASPSLLAYLPGRTQPTLITITDATYSVENYARQKLFQYFVSFTESQPDVVQGF
jgi:hypothetical protein